MSSDYTICSSYHEDYGYGQCYGTAERESTNCNGDPNKCTFYPVKKQKTTNRDWINSLSNEQLSNWLTNKYKQVVTINGYTKTIETGVHDLLTSYTDSKTGIFNWLESERN